ncbi:MAG: hypothetical protein DI556_19585 [Rhodovulum sulfidophilum]|uniref:Uncharacterized protein n=1 Tax=Rhodovulum sulfidophilum TaxID=35806 RepID=A0A2W5MZK5_RHOSU|nr:MAG: hypothetical protein DI556_19585 [Rhodovulum sulfidophilum]
MPRRRSRSEWFSIGFMTLWLILWGGAMILAFVAMGGAALGGEPAALIFLAIWLTAAGFGLYNGARRLWQLLTGEGPVRRPPVNQPWNDGMTERPRLDQDTPAPGSRIRSGRRWNDGMPPPPPGDSDRP